MADERQRDPAHMWPSSPELAEGETGGQNQLWSLVALLALILLLGVPTQAASYFFPVVQAGPASKPGRALYTAALAALLAGISLRSMTHSAGSAPLLSLEAS